MGSTAALRAALQAALESYGLRVLHDRTLYDYPSYTGSYDRAAASIAAYLAEYPDIALVLDVHRDAIGDETTIYKLADGTYMDRMERRFTYNGTDIWTDENGVEWNEAAKD